MTTHILASRTMRIRLHHVFADRVEPCYPRTMLVAILHTSVGDKYGVGMDMFSSAEIAPDTVRLIRHAGKTPAGNDMIIFADIPRADYDELVRVAQQRFPDPLRLNIKTVESLTEQAQV